jgi:hypothetical protein
LEVRVGEARVQSVRRRVEKQIRRLLFKMVVVDFAEDDQKSGNPVYGGQEQDPVAQLGGEVGFAGPAAGASVGSTSATPGSPVQPH